MWIVALPGGARLVVTFDTCAAVTQRLAVRRAPLENVGPVLKDCAQIIRRSFAAQFASGGDPAWVDLAESTVKRKRRQGFPRRTKKGNIPRRLVQNGSFGPGNKLIASGALRDSYVQSGRKGHIETYTAFSVDVGSKYPTPDGKWSLAAIHQYGATINIGSRRRPARGGVAKAKRSKPTRGGVIRIPARPLRMRGEDRVKILARYISHLNGAPS